MSSWCRSDEAGWLLELIVQPGASRDRVAGVHDGCLKVQLTARPIEGRANDALIAFLAARLGVTRRSVSIETGATSRRKRARVRNLTRPPEQLLVPA